MDERPSTEPAESTGPALGVSEQDPGGASPKKGLRRWLWGCGKRWERRWERLKAALALVAKISAEELASSLAAIATAQLLLLLALASLRVNLSPSPQRELVWGNLVILFFSTVAFLASLFLAWHMHRKKEDD